LEDGEYDAIILAYIGLKRLNLIEDIPYSPFHYDIMIPPMVKPLLEFEIP